MDKGVTLMAVPNEPTAARAVAAHAPTPAGGVAFADVISIHDWLARQDRRVAHTPRYLAAWLHEQIAAVVGDPAIARAARLADVDEFRALFAGGLDQAVTAGSDTHDLGGEELFERYANDQDFRTGLQAVAGIAAYMAVRADPALPADEFRAAAVIPTRRQQVLIKAIEDHAARYAPPHNPVGGLNPARYVAEAHVPGGASRAEWDWIAYYIAAHPEVLQRPPLAHAQLAERDRSDAEDLMAQAEQAMQRHDFDEAHALLDQAQLRQPSWNWPAVRASIDQAQTRHQAETPHGGTVAAAADARHNDPTHTVVSPTADAAPGEQPHPAAATAFPSQRVHRVGALNTETGHPSAPTTSRAATR